MATKRQRSSGSWEFIFRRKGLLARPVSLTFDDEKEGDEFAARVERLLDLGIVPADLVPSDDGPLNTVGKVIRAYRAAIAVPPSDDSYLDTLVNELSMKPMSEISLDWAEGWVADMKRRRALAPSTIRHRVGALARCFDWAGRKENVSAVLVNPLRLLPKRYASYSETDAQHAEANEQSVPGSGTRDRRLELGEDAQIRAVMGGKKPDERQRPLELNYQAALECLYDLALGADAPGGRGRQHRPGHGPDQQSAGGRGHGAARPGRGAPGVRVRRPGRSHERQLHRVGNRGLPARVLPRGEVLRSPF
ncbi:MAG: hypothetical protein AB1768_13190 [Pseudomonadota bacterium]